MTFSPNLYTLQPQGQPLNLTKYSEAELEAKKGKKRGKEICSFGGSNSQPIGCGADVLHTTLQRHSHLKAKLLLFINSE